MFEIALCDDNEEFLNMEEKIIFRYFEKEKIDGKIYRFRNGKDLVEKIHELPRLNLIFLDIDMEEMNGMQSAEQIRKSSNHSDVSIAFVTAYIRYAVEGYKVNAIRYILKDFISLETALVECLSYVFQLYFTKEPKCYIVCREGVIDTACSNIISIENRLHYCHISFWDGGQICTYSIKNKIDEVLEYIGSDNMLQIHKSFAVNIQKITDLQRYFVVLENDEKIPIAQTRYKEIREAYVAYQGRW